MTVKQNIGDALFQDHLLPCFIYKNCTFALNEEVCGICWTGCLLRQSFFENSDREEIPVCCST
jgi:hypothetical protein